MVAAVTFANWYLNMHMYEVVYCVSSSNRETECFVLLVHSV